jgi:hypothetical protein
MFPKKLEFEIVTIKHVIERLVSGN